MLQPIVRGDRGPAVEDVQKRLLVLGFDLGPTGVDGVFLGATFAAVRDFQSAHDLSEDGVVGDETWSALVDATFRLGDRLLYLKIPYLHGADVRLLQEALNILGFACGQPDGIFGAFTERAVGEFQANVGLPRDGIAGPETVRAIERLRHVWQGKDPASPAALCVAPARAAEVLRETRVALACDDERAREIAERIANLALATAPGSRLDVCGPQTEASGAVVLHLCVSGAGCERAGSPVILVGPETVAEGRFVAAFQIIPRPWEVIVAIPPTVTESEREAQATAVRILDGLCAALSG